jgi:hypothetical protein
VLKGGTNKMEEYEEEFDEEDDEETGFDDEEF